MAIRRLFCRLNIGPAQARVIAGDDQEEKEISDIDIVKAAIKNDKELVRAAVIQDATKVFKTNNNGSTALTIAAFHSNSAIVKLLLENLSKKSSVQ